jgi:hypothetical protein
LYFSCIFVPILLWRFGLLYSINYPFRLRLVGVGFIMFYLTIVFNIQEFYFIFYFYLSNFLFCVFFTDLLWEYYFIYWLIINHFLVATDNLPIYIMRITSIRELLASFEDSLLMAKNKRTHTTEETSLLRAAIKMKGSMHNKKYRVSKMSPPPNNTVM